MTKLAKKKAQESAHLTEKAKPVATSRKAKPVVLTRAQSNHLGLYAHQVSFALLKVANWSLPWIEVKVMDGALFAGETQLTKRLGGGTVLLDARMFSAYNGGRVWYKSLEKLQSALVKHNQTAIQLFDGSRIGTGLIGKPNSPDHIDWLRKHGTHVIKKKPVSEKLRKVLTQRGAVYDEHDPIAGF